MQQKLKGQFTKLQKGFPVLSWTQFVFSAMEISLSSELLQIVLLEEQSVW